MSCQYPTSSSSPSQNIAKLASLILGLASIGSCLCAAVFAVTPLLASQSSRATTAGNDVSEVQDRLLNLGYFDDCHSEPESHAVDGSFGPRTNEAVRRFQSANNLAGDGVVNQPVWEALFNRQAREAPPVVFTPPINPPAPPPSQRGLIAFSSDRDNPGRTRNIYAINREGRSVARLTDHPADDFNPAWSPDGARLAFISTRDGFDELYVMNADGSNVLQLTCSGALALEPAWSPDGMHLVFASQGGLQIVGLDGSAARPIDPAKCCIGDHHPAWSPDGTRIAFTAWDRAVVTDIWVVNVDGVGTDLPESGS